MTRKPTHKKELHALLFSDTPRTSDGMDEFVESFSELVKRHNEEIEAILSDGMNQLFSTIDTLPAMNLGQLMDYFDIEQEVDLDNKIDDLDNRLRNQGIGDPYERREIIERTSINSLTREQQILRLLQQVIALEESATVARNALTHLIFRMGHIPQRELAKLIGYSQSSLSKWSNSAQHRLEK